VDDVAASVVQLSDGGYGVTGWTYSNEGDVSGNHHISNNTTKDVWTFRVDSVGTLLWQRCSGGSADDEGFVVLANENDELFSLGDIQSDDGDVDTVNTNGDSWLIKLDTSGGLVWSKNYGSPAAESYGTGMLHTADTSLIFCGDFSLSGLWIVKLYPEGVIPLTSSITITDTISCVSTCTADLNLIVNGGTPPYSYVWNNNSITEDLFDVCNGTYSVTITDAVGSSVADTVVVNDVISCGAPSFFNIADISSISAYVSWSGSYCTIKSRVSLKNMSTGIVNLYFVNAPEMTKMLTNLTPNTTYQVKVRSQCSTNGSILSPWSNTITFTTTGAENCVYPTNISATPTSNSTATISWTPVSGAAGYQLRYKQNGATVWTALPIYNGNTSSYNLNFLSPNTTYKYQLRTKCSINPVTWSSFSTIHQFTTPMRLGEEEIANQIQLYPNPSNGTITFTSNDLAGTLYVYDIVGKEILHQVVSKQITLSDLPNGLLTYRFVSGNGLLKTDKFVVIR
jgi:hypothetical protein